MAIAALLVFAVFALVAGGARVLIQRRRTGDTGIRQFRPAPGSVQWWAHWGFVVGGLITGLVAPLADLAGLAPIPFVDRTAVTVAGAVVAVAGVAATFAAQLAMGASWRIGVDDTERTRLVTTGVFAYVRNPIFTAMLGTFAGLALMVPNPVAFVGYVLLLAGVQAQVRAVEEPYLRQVHGPAYTDYTARVGRFLPGVGCKRPTRQ
ncbi:methyltransferase family protein [Nocardia farcinica]|uniref:methyltransferase family protein n=1 Tax=Nocardia farcinica TaxID=37329 RepID=UPI0024543940|nr:isoprenylcysteine carboxylmethyltransferase family protein [Nocardia farcinica]